MKTRTMTTMMALAICLVGATAVRADICSEPVETAAGLVRGALEPETGTCVWKGIPFAEPPVGELRWRAPQSAPAWSGVREADQFGPRCMQKGTMALVDLGQGLEMSEDCLYLNVWRPAKSGSFPVMVWIHGGGYTGGTGSTEMYWGDRLSAAGEVVVVTINYRLNVFGFLAHPALTAEDPDGSSGSYGSLDQAAALKWVHDNIAGFGGDPGNVTIFGESAGGWSVCTMLATPLTRGLFHRAVLESGGCEASSSLEKGYQQARETASAIGCDYDDLDCLRAVPAKTLLDKGSGGQLGGFVWVPRHDGHLLGDQPLNLIRAGNYNQVPFIAGSNRHEVDSVLLLLPQARFATQKRYPEFLKRFLGVSDREAARIIELYPPEDYDGKVKYALGAVATDAGLGCPTYNGLAAAASHQPEVYYYRFDYQGMAGGRWLRAVHAMEIPFIFDSMDRKPISALYHRRNMEEAQKLSAVIQGYWLNFAKTGDPNGKGLPSWPRFELANPRVQVLDLPTRTEPAGMAEKCEFWDQYNRTHGPILETMGQPI